MRPREVGTVEGVPFPPPGLVDRIIDTTDLITEIRWTDQIGSTNQAALEAAAAGHPSGLVIGAEEQVAGRGRRGRNWTAPSGSALTFSLLLRPSLAPSSWPLLTLLAGSAVHTVATRVCPTADVGLKWPNDLLVGGHKAAGILLESTDQAVVIGIGLNVDWRGVDRPEGVVATSLAEHLSTAQPPADGEDLRVGLLVALLAELDRGYRDALVDPRGIVRQYVPKCATLGRTVVAQGVARGTGTAVGLTAEGHLRIRTDTGHETVVSAGEVEHLR